MSIQRWARTLFHIDLLIRHKTKSGALLCVCTLDSFWRTKRDREESIHPGRDYRLNYFRIFVSAARNRNSGKKRRNKSEKWISHSHSHRHCETDTPTPFTCFYFRIYCRVDIENKSIYRKLLFFLFSLLRCRFTSPILLSFASRIFRARGEKSAINQKYERTKSVTNWCSWLSTSTAQTARSRNIFRIFQLVFEFLLARTKANKCVNTNSIVKRERAIVIAGCSKKKNERCRKKKKSQSKSKHKTTEK